MRIIWRFVSLWVEKMNDCPFHDIKLIEQVDTRINFIIKCENQDELMKLCKIFNTKSRNISYDYAINQLGKDCE